MDIQEIQRPCIHPCVMIKWGQHSLSCQSISEIFASSRLSWLPGPMDDHFFLASLRATKPPSRNGISALWKSARLPHEKQGEDRPQEACALHFSDLQGTSLCPVLSHALWSCWPLELQMQKQFCCFFLCLRRVWSTCQVSGISTETWQHEISLWRASWGWRSEILASPKFCLRTKSTTWSKSQERVPYSGQTLVIFIFFFCSLWSRRLHPPHDAVQSVPFLFSQKQLFVQVWRNVTCCS